MRHQGMSGKAFLPARPGTEADFTMQPGQWNASMNHTTSMTETHRNGRHLWARECMRAAMRILACAAVIMAPEPAKAQAASKPNGCVSTGNVSLDLIPSVSFVIGSNLPIGAEIYRTKTYSIGYDCAYRDRFNTPVRVTPQIQSLDGFQTLYAAVSGSGLEISIIIDGDEQNPWKPTNTTGEFRSLAPDYEGETGPRFVSILAKLTVTSNNTSARRFAIPQVELFKIIPAVGFGRLPGPIISSTPTRIQFTPQCIGDVSVDNLVRFDGVIASAGYMGTLPQQHPFNVTARINPSCYTGELLTPAAPDNAFTQFFMLLSAQFVLQGAGRIDGDGQSIILVNDDGVENGLKMQILNNANQPVKILLASIPTSIDDVGNFGQLMGASPAAAVHTYTASLMADAGKDLKLGKYSTQVLVKLSFY